MKSTVYNFSPKYSVIDNKVFLHRDYFEYYTTGVESIIPENPDSFAFTTRETAERPEQIMYDIFSDADLADIFVAVNNQNYLWATPFGLDAFQDAIEFRMNYVELLMRDRIERINTLDGTGEEILDDKGDPIWEYNSVGQDVYQKVSDDIHNEDDIARTVVVPDVNNYQLVSRKIKEYFESRKVE